MPKTLAVTGCLVLLLLSACGQARFFDPTAEIKQAAEAAFADLAEQPALLVEGSVSSLGGTGSVQADIQATILNDNTAWAEFSSKDDDGQILSLPDSTHVRGGAKYWEADGYGPDMSKSMAGTWVTVDSNDWFSPGNVFNPATFGPEIYKDLLEQDSLQIVTPDTVEVDGVTAYPIVFRGGTIHISAKAPHRLLDIDEALLTVPDSSNGNHVTGTFSVTVAQQSDIESLHEVVGEALDGMDEVFNQAYPEDTDSEITESLLDCDSRGFCTMYATMKVSFDPTPFITELLFVQSASVDGGDLGVDECTSDKTAEPNDSVKLSCVTDFSHATGRYEVEGTQFVYFIGVYEFDSSPAIETLDAVVESLLAELD